MLIGYKVECIRLMQSIIMICRHERIGNKGKLKNSGIFANVGFSGFQPAYHKLSKNLINTES